MKILILAHYFRALVRRRALAHLNAVLAARGA